MALQEYYLVCLMEECAEVQQIAAKSLRFGLTDEKPSTGERNYDQLVQEFNDILAVVDLLKEEGVDLFRSKELQERKKERVRKYLQRSIDNGVLPCLQK